ncbi:MAG: acylphosphatase [Candidatus Spechtbacterales bacterium]|nr:acylphosphatase [Candidatus Spechtbacterales bacterium]
MHINIKVTGRVQGVFFRHSTRKKAESLDIKGFVKNEPDGSVYIEAEGEPSALEDFISWVKEGPRAARVDNVQIEKVDTEKNFTGFGVRH